MKIHITGLQRAQRRNLKRIAALSPQGYLGLAVRNAAAETHRALTNYTPWDTGALRASRRIKFAETAIAAQARVFTDPQATNPRGGCPPAIYDAFLHARGMCPGRRGGILASMPFTVRLAGPRIRYHMLRTILGGFRG